MSRRWDMAPGSEAVGAYQMLTAWAVLVVTQQSSERSLAVIGIGAAAAVAVGFLHGTLLVKPLALLGRWTARVTAWPRAVAVAAMLAPLSAGVAGGVAWWLRSQSVATSVGFLQVWALTAAAAVLPLVAGAVLHGRPVPARAVWRQGAVIAGGVVGVVTMMTFVMELPV
ncbi:hypothetical protein [Streptomyces sp. NPDC051183]|uniref:hypothetical protein n=1 Tax=unclassified Streptomyces TaxID=2593676 RepID=UPI003414F9BB